MAAVSPSVAAAATNTATAATGPVRPGDIATAPCQAPSANNKPIRPNALMNFSTSMLAAAPTTRLRPPPPPAAAGSNCGFESALARGAGRQGRQGQLISASQAHQSQQQQPSQQSPKALSPSGGLNDSLPSQILPHLYVGNQEQTNRDTLSKLNIKYILSLGLLPQLLQSGACTTSISPSSPGKMAPTGTAPTSTGPTNGTSKQNSGTNNNNIASSTPSSRATSATSHLNPQQQQQQILMPERDSSRDFKIRLRPLTPTKPSASSTTATASPSEHHIYQHYRHQRAAANQERVGCTQAPMADGAKHELASGNGAYEAQFAAAAAAAATDDDENKRVKQLRSIHCKCINITDSSEQSLMSFFDEAFAFIDEARRRKCNILIHCLAGISRSPTIAIAYLMRVKSLHWREAYDLVKKSRPQIDPNLNFMGQLRIYNKSLRAAHRGPHELDERRVNY